jgi:hypothetical protein
MLQFLELLYWTIHLIRDVTDIKLKKTSTVLVFSLRKVAILFQHIILFPPIFANFDIQAQINLRNEIMQVETIRNYKNKYDVGKFQGHDSIVCST